MLADFDIDKVMIPEDVTQLLQLLELTTNTTSNKKTIGFINFLTDSLVNGLFDNPARDRSAIEIYLKLLTLKLIALESNGFFLWTFKIPERGGNNKKYMEHNYHRISSCKCLKCKIWHMVFCIRVNFRPCYTKFSKRCVSFMKFLKLIFRLYYLSPLLVFATLISPSLIFINKVIL